MASLALSEDEVALRQTAREAARRWFPVSELRRLRDERDATGFSRQGWRELARLGVAGLTLEPGAPGLGALGVVAEELGRTLAATPLLSTVVLGAGALDESWRRELVPGVVAGERVLALAHDEGTRHSREVETRVEGGRVSGEKTLVVDGHVADHFVVSARDGMYLVPAGAPGMTVTRLALLDGRNAARVRFAETPVTAKLGGRLAAILDRGAAVLAAEMLGGALEAFERTLAHLRTRQQFGVPIGSFQALKHRAARLHCELELLRSVVRAALRALDDAHPDAPALCSAAKARASDVFLAVTSEAIQMHGGIGVTDELDIGLFYKRARVCELLLGDAAWHRRKALKH